MVRAKHWLVVALLSVHFLQAQETPPTRPSPTAITAARYKDTYVKITYCQPAKRGREIFGKLVPYGEVWRTGANEATEITITRDIFIQDTLLTAGTYSLFSIPEKDHWIIIINKEVGLWGAYNYNPKMDVMRLTVPVKDTGSSVYQSFIIQLDQRNNVADLLLIWDRTKITIPLQFIEPKP